ncbi:MAG: hypothetical protein RL722_831 [Pseudomonadota bacterium]|jgi:uncharacterized membrane protein YecN with MAPEG domain
MTSALAPLSLTPLFVGLLVLMQVALTFIVIARRHGAKVSLMDGGDPALLRRIRAHGNFTETVPITLLAMLVAEWTGAPAWLLWAGGGALLLGRGLHASSLIRRGMGAGRGAGMVLTFIAMVTFAVWDLQHVLAGVA